jgi:hypothetical protein
LVSSFLEFFFLLKLFHCISLSLFHLFPFLFYSFCVLKLFFWFMFVSCSYFVYIHFFLYLFIYLFCFYFLFKKDSSFFNMFYNENNF